MEEPTDQDLEPIFDLGSLDDVDFGSVNPVSVDEVEFGSVDVRGNFSSTLLEDEEVQGQEESQSGHDDRQNTEQTNPASDSAVYVHYVFSS